MNSAENRFYRLMSMLVAVVVLTGCASLFQRLDDNMHRKRFKSDYEALENALDAYDRGAYEQAHEQFQQLASTSTSQIYARKAKLGVICCLLILAETQDAYTTAVGMWHHFAETAAVDKDIWDIRLLDPLVVRMTPKTTTRVVYIHPPAEQRTVPTEIQPSQPSDSRLPSSKELTILKKKAARADHLQREVDRIEAENRSLKEKIKALEAIDQSMQKKKTEISAPGE